MPALQAGGVVGHVGRKGLRFALVDEHGCVMPATMRQYGADQDASVSGNLCRFQRDLALDRLPPRVGLALAGLARGDVISITQTRWFVSRSGLQAMLGQPPLLLNDFEAEAWALTGNQAIYTPIGSAPMVTIDRPGAYCVIGMTSGLGVSVLSRQPSGAVTVFSTEAGHAGFAPASRAIADLVAAMFPNRYPVVTEQLISATGLVVIYNTLAAMEKSPKRMTRPEDVTRQIATDPLARQACTMLCEAFWSHAAGLVLTYGTWDGVIVTGTLAHVLRNTLAAAPMQQAFAGTGKYARLLAAVPRSLMTMEHGELFGAAEAMQRRHVGG